MSVKEPRLQMDLFDPRMYNIPILCFSAPFYAFGIHVIKSPPPYNL